MNGEQMHKIATMINSVAIMILAIAIIVLALSGCTTLVNGPTQEILITSEPPGAVVTPTDYKRFAYTPGAIHLDRNQGTTLTARLEGYEDCRVEVKCGLSLWAFGNAAGQAYPHWVLGVPHAGIALLMLDVPGGGLGELSPTYVHFEMVKK